MERREIPIVGGEARAASRFVSSRSLVNCFLEPSDGRLVLYGGPGLAARQTLSGTHLRGLYAFGEVLLAVCGQRLYTVTRAGVATDRGNIPGTEPVDISDNGLQAMIVVAEEASQTSYVWDGAALGQITDPDFYPASSVDFVDQYMVTSIVGDEGRYQISSLLDATSWSAIDVATAEARPDPLVRVWVDSRDLLLMGSRTIQGQYNSGAADFPFENTQLFFEIGVAGRHCVAQVDNSVAFLANDGTVRIIRGGTPVVISTPDIAATIASWANPGAALALSFTLRNHAFFVLRHPDGCVMWDASAPPADAWSVRRSYNSPTWRIGYAVTIWDQVIAGAADSGELFTLDAGVHAEGDEPLVRELVSRGLGPGGPFTLHGVEAQIEPGVGIVSGQGDDPQVWMQLSRNSGRTFGARMLRKIGARGDYERRIVWRSNYGQFRPEGGVISIGCSDPVPFVLKTAHAEFTADMP